MTFRQACAIPIVLVGELFHFIGDGFFELANAILGKEDL